VERGEKTVAEIRAAGGKADFISSNLRDASSAREVARRAIELGNGHVDILINSAGIFPFGPTHETTEEMFDSVYSLNVKAPYFLVAELASIKRKLELADAFTPLLAVISLDPQLHRVTPSPAV
jgi:NAD(P)-dependent dehydrogenase (short-subunit alcohol dehydrogenase family)